MTALYILLYFVVGLLVALGWQYLITFFGWNDTDSDGRMMICLPAWPGVIIIGIVIGFIAVLYFTMIWIFGPVHDKVRKLAEKHRGY